MGLLNHLITRQNYMSLRIVSDIPTIRRPTTTVFDTQCISVLFTPVEVTV